MYKLGKRPHKRHTKFIFGVFIVLLAGSVYVLKDFHPKSTATIQNAAAVIQRYDGDSAQKVHYDGGNFTMDLPSGWKLMNRQTTPYNFFSFVGTTGDDRYRIIGIYEDSIPLKTAVNRVLVVQGQGSTVTHDASVSDNCFSYTSTAQQQTPDAIRTKIVTDKWEEVNFYCDIGNYLRNVTGTSSAAQGINDVSLTGKTSGAHQFFFTFTDSTISPDYSPFYNMLDSFKLK